MAKHVTRATIADTVPLLYTKEQAEAIIAGYPAHERDARAKGIPQLGSGRCFPLDLETVKVTPFAIPKHWRQIIGIDFGYDHPFGAVRLAHDADSDTIYLINEYRKREATPVVHSAAIKPWGSWIPVAWPADGLRKDKDPSGKEFRVLYREQGLNMLEEKATFDGGGVGVEAGVLEMLDRMETGRWKVFSTCGAWIDEASLYHRKDGVIVDEAEDLICASRYAMMMRRFAIPDPGENFDLSRPLFANTGTQA